MKSDAIYTWSCLILLLIVNFLTACGTATELDSDDDKSGLLVPAQSEDLPDFSRWHRYPGATDKCLTVGAGEVYCQVEFQAGSENCPYAVWKFVAIKAGYMYVQTKEGLLIRQGEFHQLNFNEQAEIFNVTDNTIEHHYSVYKCFGPNGEEIPGW